MFDLRPVGYVIGLLVTILGATMMLPMIADLAEGRGEWHVFFQSGLLTMLIGGGIALSCMNGVGQGLTIQQTFLLASGVWVALPLFGAIPFILGETELRFVDAFFESMSGMTTTGSTVITGLDTLPRGILLTLAITAVLYFLVVSVVVLVVPMSQLADTAAPLAFVFDEAGSTTSGIFHGISIIATTNGVLIQIIMASRVIYGLAKQKNLPAFLTAVNPVTRTPVVATVVVVALVLIFATLLPIAELAEATSTLILVVFCLVNLALIRMKRSEAAPSGGVFAVPIWVPAAGLLLSVMLLITGFLTD